MLEKRLFSFKFKLEMLLVIYRRNLITVFDTLFILLEEVRRRLHACVARFVDLNVRSHREQQEEANTFLSLSLHTQGVDFTKPFLPKLHGKLKSMNTGFRDNFVP
jgi:hypothetical protein